MQLLEDRIRSCAKHIGNGIVKVDSFLNHQIDSMLMQSIGEEFARRLGHSSPNKILTAETSGILPALATGMAMKLPVVYARKHKPITMAEKTFSASSVSPTHGNIIDLVVSSEYLGPKDRVLIIDDVLASAHTIKSLLTLVEESGATLVGIGTVIEKTYSGGRKVLGELNVPIVCLATIKGFENEKIIVETSCAGESVQLELEGLA